MDRRHFLCPVSAASAAFCLPASAAQMVDYTPVLVGVRPSLLREKPCFVDLAATCVRPLCRPRARYPRNCRPKNPDFCPISPHSRPIGNGPRRAEITQRLGDRVGQTTCVLKVMPELGSHCCLAGRVQIKQLMDTALGARDRNSRLGRVGRDHAHRSDRYALSPGTSAPKKEKKKLRACGPLTGPRSICDLRPGFSDDHTAWWVGC